MQSEDWAVFLSCWRSQGVLPGPVSLPRSRRELFHCPETRYNNHQAWISGYAIRTCGMAAIHSVCSFASILPGNRRRSIAPVTATGSFPHVGNNPVKRAPDLLPCKGRTARKGPQKMVNRTNTREDVPVGNGSASPDHLPGKLFCIIQVFRIRPAPVE